MAGSAQPKHYPSDPCRGADPPFPYPAIEHCAGGRCFAVGLTRVNITACDQSPPLA